MGKRLRHDQRRGATDSAAAATDLGQPGDRGDACDRRPASGRCGWSPGFSAGDQTRGLTSGLHLPAAGYHRRMALLRRDEARTSSDQPKSEVRRDQQAQGVDRDHGWFATLKRTFTEFQEDNLSDWAAALTYYGLLSLFPALIAMVSLIGIFGDPKSTTESLTEIITEIGPESAAETFSGPIESLTEHAATAGLALIVGLAVSLWSASGYVGAFMRASNVIYETPEGRPFWKLRPLQIAVTLS